MPFFEFLGYRSIGAPLRHPEFGEVLPMVLLECRRPSSTFIATQASFTLMNPVESVVIAGFAACFLSFIWGMQRFFQVDGVVPAGARIIQLTGAASMIGQVATISRSVHFTVASGMLGALFYVLSLVLFWSAINANWRRAIQIVNARG